MGTAVLSKITASLMDSATFSIEYAILATLAWGIIFPLLVLLFRKSAEIFASSMPPQQARLPSALPHPNPAGAAVEFPVLLTEATSEHVKRFMEFRGVKSWDIAQGLRSVALEAAAYKGELFDDKLRKWEHEHFQLRRPSLKFPFPSKCWNGWSGCWSEAGAYRRAVSVGNLALGVEHVINGLFMPIMYLQTGDSFLVHYQHVQRDRHVCNYNWSLRH